MNRDRIAATIDPDEEEEERTAGSPATGRHARSRWVGKY